MSVNDDYRDRSSSFSELEALLRVMIRVGTGYVQLPANQF